jgi:hypothetical protein
MDKADSGLNKVALVFKDLRKLASDSQKGNTTKEVFQRLQDKPF